MVGGFGQVPHADGLRVLCMRLITGHAAYGGGIAWTTRVRSRLERCSWYCPVRRC